MPAKKQTKRAAPHRRRPTTVLTLDETTLAVVAARGGQTGERSASVDRIVLEHDWLLRSARPALSPNEWRLLCDLLNGTLLSMPHARMLCYEFEDALRMDSARPVNLKEAWAPHGDSWSHKWQVDAPALLARLQALPPVQLAAILDVVRRWWASQGVEDHPVPGEDGYVESVDPLRVDGLLERFLAL